MGIYVQIDEVPDYPHWVHELEKLLDGPMLPQRMWSPIYNAWSCAQAFWSEKYGYRSIQLTSDCRDFLRKDINLIKEAESNGKPWNHRMDCFPDVGVIYTTILEEAIENFDRHCWPVPTNMRLLLDTLKKYNVKKIYFC